ncbi:unnamed protein product, partial [Staurois parvus]
MIQEMVRDCGHDTRDGQRLRTVIQEMVRDCGHDTRD